MNLLLILALSSTPAAPVPAPDADQEIQIAKSFELGPLGESFNLVSADYKFDQNNGVGILNLKLEAKKEIDPALLRSLYAGFFDDDNTLQRATVIRPSLAFPLQKGERLMFQVQTGGEDKKWSRIVVRKSDVSPSSAASRFSPAAERGGAGGFGVPAGREGREGRGGGGFNPNDVVPPPANPFDR
jgi:hypothetical protein